MPLCSPNNDSHMPLASRIRMNIIEGKQLHLHHICHILLSPGSGKSRTRPLPDAAQPLLFLVRLKHAAASNSGKECKGVNQEGTVSRKGLPILFSLASLRTHKNLHWLVLVPSLHSACHGIEHAQCILNRHLKKIYGWGFFLPDITDNREKKILFLQTVRNLQTVHGQPLESSRMCTSYVLYY